MTRLSWRPSLRLSTWLAAGICLSVVTLAWLGFLASREWQRSSVALVQRRADEAARMLVTAVTRDMRAVQTSVLTSPTWDEFAFDSPSEIATLVATAFARYPYPESFFAWRAGDPPTRFVFFTRTDRRPVWIDTVAARSRYPVQTVISPAVAGRLMSRIQTDGAEGRSLSVFETDIGGTQYEIVTRLKYRDQFNQELVGAFGFLVNLPWVKERYFSELTNQMARIGRDDVGLALGIIDDRGHLVSSTSEFVDAGVTGRQTFPMMFFDPRAIVASPPPDLTRRVWTIVASGAADPTLAWAFRGANWTLAAATMAAVVLALGLLLSARAVKASAELADMRTEFMSSVTHELKTPISAIRALGETLMSGRIAEAEDYREYGGLVAHEGKRLSRLVDNVLVHSRMTDVADVYSFGCLDVAELVRTAISAFRFQMQQGGFTIETAVPPDLPAIIADPTAMELVMDNLIDNAIRYSGTSRRVFVDACRQNGTVAISISDNGIGIPKEDLGVITQRFVRGRNAVAGGSGLGLAIVKRIVNDHHGSITIESSVGRGTTVRVNIPVAEVT
jgi:signal transduction histidine kinase